MIDTQAEDSKEISIFRKSTNFLVGLVIWSVVLGFVVVKFLDQPSYRYIPTPVESQNNQEEPTFSITSAQSVIGNEQVPNSSAAPAAGNSLQSSEQESATKQQQSTEPKAETQTIETAAIVENQTAEESSNVTPAAAPTKPSEDIPFGWYVQVGAFKSENNARVFSLKLTKDDFPVRIKVGADKLSHVLVGPYKSEKIALDIKNILAKETNIKGLFIRDFSS